MKKKYVAPSAEITHFETEDIIMVSGMADENSARDVYIWMEKAKLNLEEIYGK